MAKRPRIDVNLRRYFKGEERGWHDKDMIVLHETVSHNRPGVGDITSVASYMDSTGLEIHAIVDKEGHSGWSYDSRAIYDHCASNGGNVNSRSIGIEIVSSIPFIRQKEGRDAARAEWKKMEYRKQLNTVAQWVAWLSEIRGIPMRYSRGDRPGVTSHWDVSQTFNVPGGHWDCHPNHRGGYFPLLYVVYKARQLR